MSVEGVMVSYNHSEGEQANIITVAASGIRFSNRWVLTHGSILSPLKQAEIVGKSKGKPILNDQFYEDLPEIYVSCEPPPANSQSASTAPHAAPAGAGAGRREDVDSQLQHSSYQVRVLTGRICHVWQCAILDRCVDDILYSWTIGHRDGDADKQTQLGKDLLSVFVLVDLECDDRGQKSLRPLSELYDLVRPPPARGATVEVYSTPFGNEVFLNSVTRGTVCGVVGRRPSLILTDAATALGSEGGPVFSQGENSSRWLVGCVVCSVSWWRGEWVGLTLAAPLCSVLAAKLRLTPSTPLTPLTPTTPPSEHDRLHHTHLLDKIDSTTVLVRCGAAWGAGVYLGNGYVVTCAHVVKNHTTTKISLYCQGVSETAIVRYKTADDKAYDLSLLYSNPENLTHLIKARFATEPAKKGEPVLAAGYPYFSENNLEDLKATVTSGHVNNVSPSMIQTSCCVQSGFSGGAIYRASGEPASEAPSVLGIVVCNARAQTGACFPHINMAVPVAAFTDHFRRYVQDKDSTSLKMIENKQDMVQAQWRLMPYRSKI